MQIIKQLMAFFEEQKMKNLIIFIFDEGFNRGARERQLDLVDQAIQNYNNVSLVQLNPLFFIKHYYRFFIKKVRDEPRPWVASAIKELPLNTLHFFLFLGFEVIFFLPAFVKFSVTSWIRSDWEKALKFQRIYNIDVGENIYSAFLRSRFSRGLIEKSPKFLIYYSFSYIYCSYITIFLKSISFLNQGKNFEHFASDPVYLSGYVRKILSNVGSVEKRFRYDKWLSYSRFVDARSVNIIEQYNRNYDPYSFLDNHDEDIRNCKKRTENFFSSKEKVLSASARSVSVDRFNILNPESIIVFKHRVSDAQFCFGVDGFIDINDWLMRVIEVSLAKGYTVYVRPHPEMTFTSYFSSEIKYIKFINEFFSIDMQKLRSERVVATNTNNIYFISPYIPIEYLAKDNPGCVYVAKHGTVAAELAQHGIRTLVSTASPYEPGLDTFVNFYSDTNSLRAQLSDRESLIFQTKDEYSLYRYICRSKDFYVLVSSSDTMVR